jgi:hypothetical protein
LSKLPLQGANSCVEMQHKISRGSAASNPATALSDRVGATVLAYARLRQANV